MADMSAWLQLVLTLAGVAGLMAGGLRWALRGFETRVGVVVRAETAPAFAQVEARFTQVETRFAHVEARFAGVDAQFVEVRHQMEVANHRLGAVEGDMSLIKRRLLSVDQA